MDEYIYTAYEADEGLRVDRFVAELNEEISIPLDLSGMEDDELRDRMLRLAEVLEDAAVSNTGLEVTIEEDYE